MAKISAEESDLSKDNRRMCFVEGVVKAMQACLSDINNLQRRSLMSRQRELTKNIPFCSGQLGETEGSITKLKRGLADCVRRVARWTCHGDEDIFEKKPTLQSLVQGLAYERIWFDSVVAQRQKMLELYRMDLLNSGEDVADLVCLSSRDGPYFV